MKKKSVVFILTFLAAVVSTLIFTGCAKTKVRYSIENDVAHVASVDVSSDSGVQGDKDGNYFFLGTPINVTVYLDAGYQLGTIKVSINGEEQELVPLSSEVSNTGYQIKEKYTTETEQVTITLSGEASAVTSSVVVEYAGLSDCEPFEEDIFVKINDGTEYSLKEFKELGETARTLTDVKASDEFSVRFYTKNYAIVGFNGNSSISATYLDSNESVTSNKNRFLLSGDECGLQTSFYIYRDAKIYIVPSPETVLELEMTKGDTSDRVPLKNNVFTVKVNGEEKQPIVNGADVYAEFSDFATENTVEVSIEFSDAAQVNAIKDGLYFKVGWDANNHAFSIDGNKIVLNLKRPYEYSELGDGTQGSDMDIQFAYRWFIETNLYEKIIDAGIDFQEA